MKTRPALFSHPQILMFAALVLVSACAPPAPTGFTDADRATIMADEDAFEVAADARDWAAVAAHYAEDAVLMAPSTATVAGRAAIEEWHMATPEGTELDLEVVQVDGSGDLAYVHGTYSMTWPMGDETGSDSGRYVEIRRKAADGSWPIVLDIINSAVPPPAPPM